MKSLHVQKNMDFWVENLVGAADALISIFSLSVCDRAACSKLLHLLFLPAPVSSSFPPPSAPFYLPSPPLPFSPFSLLINLFFSKVCCCTCNYHTHSPTHTPTLLIIGPGQQAALKSDCLGLLWCTHTQVFHSFPYMITPAPFPRVSGTDVERGATAPA